MKKFLIIITFFIILFTMSVMIVLTKNIFDPPTDIADQQQGQNTFSSLNNELSISLPPEFQVSTSLDEEDNSDSETIFVATSSQDILTIKTVPSDENLNVTQKEMVDAMYGAIKQITVNEIGSEIITWKDISTTNFGKNYFIHRNGLRTGYSEYEDYPLNEGIRQDITYSKNKAYFITFTTIFPNIDKTKYWDQIVTSISFK